MGIYNFSNGGQINIGKQISIDAKGMSNEDLLRLVDAVVHDGKKAVDETDVEQTATETAEMTETRTVRVTRTAAKSDEIVAVDSRYQDRVIGLLDQYLEGKQDRAAGVVVQAFVMGALIIKPTFGQFKKRYGADVLDKTLYYRYVGADKTAILKEEYQPILNQLKQILG